MSRSLLDAKLEQWQGVSQTRTQAGGGNYALFHIFAYISRFHVFIYVSHFRTPTAK